MLIPVYYRCALAAAKPVILLFSVFLKGQTWPRQGRCRDREAVFSQRGFKTSDDCLLTATVAPTLSNELWNVFLFALSPLLIQPQPSVAVFSYPFQFFFSPHLPSKSQDLPRWPPCSTASKSDWSDLGGVPLSVSCRERFNH